MTAEVVSIAVPAPTAAYGRHLAPARRFVDDAAGHLAIVAGAVGGRLTQLAGTDATCAAVIAAIHAAAQRLRDVPAGLFVLAYAGHAGRVPDTDGDEDDGFDEAWALDDAPLTDDVLGRLLAAFHVDVHVVLISNCCFSAGIADAPARWPHGSSDGLPAVGPRVRLFEPPPIATNRVVISSCSERQMTVIQTQSRLTRRVLDTVFPADGDVRRRAATDYAALEREVAGMASVAQTPMVVASGPDLRRQAFVPQRLVP
jgi:hypothetical protein